MDSRPTKAPSSAVNDSATDAHSVSDKTPTYLVSTNARHSRRQYGSLVDRGANGCIIGSDMRKIKSHCSFTHLSGIDDHTVRDLPLVTAGAFVRTSAGPIILIVHQGAHMPDGKTILSPGQMEHFGWTIDDKSPAFTGTVPTVTSLDGHVCPWQSSMV